MTAVALPNVKITPLLLTRVTAIALLYAAALSFNGTYIDSIGSGVGIYSGLFKLHPFHNSWIHSSLWSEL
jgi:NADH-ubiquinone oxidoreductase chain 2